MAENLDKCSVDTQIMISVLMSTIGECLKSNELIDLRLFFPAKSDMFLIKAFEEKLGHPIDEIYSICIEDHSSAHKESNFTQLNELVTEYAQFLMENNKLKYDGYRLETVGVLQVVNQGRTFYYIAFIMEIDSPIAQA